MEKWIVDTTERFDRWLRSQDEAMIEDVLSSLQTLELFGPRLGRPDVDQIKGSAFKNMKELRVQSNGRPVRAFFAFDPLRMAIVLCAGDKTGQKSKRFYSEMIKIADAEYTMHLEGIST